MFLEFAGDELVGRADEMQNLDDLAVRCHGTARRRDDDGGRGGGDQRQDRDAAQGEGPRHGANLMLPAAMVVERDAFEIPAERRSDFG